MKVIKRNGSEATFDPKKISSAITKANLSVAENFRISDEKIEEITKDITNAAKKAKNDGTVKFTLYGTELQVKFNPAKRVKVKNGTDEEIDKCLAWLDASTDATLQDCQRIKQEQELCDWAYVKMLDKLSQTSLGKTNEGVLLMAGLMSRSGYDVKVARYEKGQLRMLYKSDAFIYNTLFFTLDNQNFFQYGDSLSGAEKVKIAISFNPGGKKVDLSQNPVIKAVKLTEPRTLTSKKNPDFSFTVQVNKNLVDFYDEMPSFTDGKNFMTRWTTMANRPLDKYLQQTLVKQMKDKLKGKSQKDQVQQILSWMHGEVDLDMKATNSNFFLYGYDEDVWGYDRPFYAEQTLFYPYCDTEDRSILLSRLVRDVVGIDVVFIYYPEHTAIGVCITDEDVKGAYVVLNGRHYVICDPTYIGSEVGEEMPSIEGKKRTVMKLER